MPATSYFREKLANHIMGLSAYTVPPLYLALFTANPGDGGSQVSEIAVGGYARQALTGVMGAADPVTGYSINTAVINFPIATVEWPAVAYLAFVDALTGGNILNIGHPSVPKIIAAGQRFQLPVGQVKFRVS